MSSNTWHRVWIEMEWNGLVDRSFPFSIKWWKWFDGDVEMRQRDAQIKAVTNSNYSEFYCVDASSGRRCRLRLVLETWLVVNGPSFSPFTHVGWKVRTLSCSHQLRIFWFECVGVCIGAVKGDNIETSSQWIISFYTSTCQMKLETRNHKILRWCAIEQ